MKKSLFTLAVLAIAATTQAATINWGNLAASSIVGLDGTTKLTSTAAATAGFAIQVMYLPLGMTSYATAAPSTDTSGSAASMSTKTAGLLTATSDLYVFGSPYTTGSQFFIRATAKFGTKSYFMDVFRNNTYGTTFALTALTNTGSDTFTWAAANYGGEGAAGQSGKWVAVPEPATGMLALAGAALLIRRRRRG